MDLLQFKKYCEFQPLTKKQIEDREVTGIVLYSEKMDLQNEIYGNQVIKSSMNNFMEHYQHLGEMHKQLAEAFLTENYQLENGDWYITAKVRDDDLWDKVKNVEYTGFSIGGRAGGYWIDENKTQKRLTTIITEEISFVDKAANGGMYAIVKRFDEGGGISMSSADLEMKMKEALEASRKAAEESGKKTKALEDKLVEVTKQLDGNQEKIDGWDATIKSLQDKYAKPPETPELEASINKKFTDIVGVVKNMSDRLEGQIEDLTKRLEAPAYKGLGSNPTGYDRNQNLTGDPKVDLVSKNLDFFSNPGKVNKAMEQGFDVVEHARNILFAL